MIHPFYMLTCLAEINYNDIPVRKSLHFHSIYKQHPWKNDAFLVQKKILKEKVDLTPKNASF